MHLCEAIRTHSIFEVCGLASWGIGLRIQAAIEKRPHPESVLAVSALEPQRAMETYEDTEERKSKTQISEGLGNQEE